MNFKIKEPLENINGTLTIGGVLLTELATNYGTPLFVTDEIRIRDNYRRLKKAFEKTYSDVKIFYSMKANSNISLLKILLDEGSLLDATSIGEIFIALKSGFSHEKIMYTGTSVGNDDLKFAVESNVIINIDSLSQFNRLIKMHIPSIISVRLNPGIGSGHHKHVVTAGSGSKFGLTMEDALKIYHTAHKIGIKEFGFHMHIGSGNMQIKPYITALKHLLDLVVNVKKTTGINAKFIDIGGGIGIPYKPNESTFPIELFASKVSTIIKKFNQKHGFGEPALYLEPGRYIMGDSSVLLTKIQDVKESEKQRFIGVDAGFNILIRPAMYGSYHEIIPLTKINNKNIYECSVVGPLCESGDHFGHFKFPSLKEGDILAIMDVGAYGYCMSSQYNSRPRAAEVLVKNGEFELIRKRENLEDLLTSQRIASWLK